MLKIEDEVKLREDQQDYKPYENSNKKLTEFHKNSFVKAL